MARNTVNYTITDEGRDKGKVFVLTELPASHAEAWAMRALMALMAAGADISPEVVNAGMAGMAQVGLQALAGLKWEVAEPLLEEMWKCVKVMPDPARPQVVRDLLQGEGGEDIEEISTRVKLRAEVWKLHVGFFKAAALSDFVKQAAAKASPSRTIKTSRQRSVR